MHDGSDSRSLLTTATVQGTGKCQPTRSLPAGAATSCQELPARRGGWSKLGLLADKKEELSRDMYYDKVLTQREKFFEDPI